MDGHSGRAPTGAVPSAVKTDPPTFESVVRESWSRMARLAYRLTGGEGWEDVLQDALTLAWRKRDRVDPTRENAGAWLLALVADRARKSRRAAHRRPTHELLDDHISVEQATSDVDLERAFDRLSARQRLAVDLYYFLGLPVAQVAAV